MALLNHLEQLHWDVLEQDRIIFLRQMHVNKNSSINMMLAFTPFNEKRSWKAIKENCCASNRIEMQEEAHG